MVKKIVFGLLAAVVLLAIGIAGFVSLNWNKTYDIPLVELQSSTDSSVIAKGKYLVHGPAHCSNCHVSSYENLILADKGEDIPLKGGVRFHLGPLGEMSSGNLTSDPKTGLGRYSDAQVFRMMRHAVKPNGKASIALMMPFWNMADEELIAVVSYLRTLPAEENEVEPPEWTTLGKVVKTFVKTFEPIYEPQAKAKAPPMEATYERGEYIARYVANCVGCHTPRDLMTFEAIGPEYSGGLEMEPDVDLNRVLGVDDDLWTRSTNLTPHSTGVLLNFPTLEDWIARYRMGRIIPNSPMPWGPFSRMTDEDLGALYIYLNALDPVDHDVGDIVFKKVE